MKIEIFKKIEIFTLNTNSVKIHINQVLFAMFLVVPVTMSRKGISWCANIMPLVK